MLAFNVAQLLKEGLGAFRQLQLSGELFEVETRRLANDIGRLTRAMFDRALRAAARRAGLAP